MLALAFALTIVAVLSYVIMTSITPTNTRVIIDPATVRGFKRDELTSNIKLIVKRSRWVNVKLSAVRSQLGVDTRFEVLPQGIARISVRSKYAGRFKGLTLQLEATDILNLFQKEIQAVYTDFAFESLPLSILAPIPRSRPMPLTLGEKSGRSPGSSLELYALDEYQPYTETKNVMWKRVARMPDERLIVRIRDSTIPRIVTIGFIQNKKRHEQANLVWMDRACEAIGTMGNSLLAAGCMIELIQTSEEIQGNTAEPIIIHEISSLDELSNAIMQLPDIPNPGENFGNILQVLNKSDIIVCGLWELEDRILAIPISKKPTLAIAEEKTSPVMVGQRTMIYTGVEDVRKLVSSVLEM